MRLVCPKNNACVTLWEGIVFFGNSKCTLYAQDQIQIVERKLSNSLFVRLNARFSPLNVRLLLQMCVYFVNSPDNPEGEGELFLLFFFNRLAKVA